MNILITGGAGYIGSITSNKLNALGHKVIVLDDLSEGKKESVSKLTFYKGNYGDEKLILHILTSHSIDTVMHFGASSNVKESTSNPELYYHNNVINSLKLLKSCREYRKLNPLKFIFSSTAAVYGESEKEIIKENQVQNPVNPYGRSKLMVEQALKDYYKYYKEEYLIFRFFCVAGATKNNGESRQSKETHLIPLTVESVLNSKNILNIYGNNFSTPDGSGVRDYIHVEDVAEAHVRGMLQWESVKNSTYNIGTDRGYSVKEIIKKANEIFNIKINTQIHPQRPGDPEKLIACNKNLKDKFKWEPKRTIEDMLLTAYQWRKNPKY
jgi:UDP-glucose 4-epimerase